MRIVFMGTPALAIPSLEALAKEHEIVLAVTQPDKPAGRGHKLVAPPVKEYAVANGIPVLQPEKAHSPEFVEQLRQTRPEAIAVVAYGQILPKEILEMPTENFVSGGCVNLHFSLLPRWRGAAPVQYSVWNGDTVTGVTTQWMAEKLDAGDVILQREVPLELGETSGSLFEKLTPLGAEVLSETMRLMSKGEAPRHPQDENQATFAPTIKKEQTRIDWTKGAEEVSHHINALSPKPGAWCEFRGEAFKILKAIPATSAGCSAGGDILLEKNQVFAGTAQDCVQIYEVQPAGKPRMAAADWARGIQLKSDEKFE